MKYNSPSKYYHLEIPDNWTIEEKENTTSLYDEKNGYGAINITSYEIPSNYDFNVRNELIEFIGEDLNISEDGIKINQNNMQRAYIELDNEGSYWQYHTFYHNCKALFITYNFETPDKESEKQLIDKIIQSVIIN